MIESEEITNMTKDRKSSEEIIASLIESLTTNPQSLHKLMTISKELGTPLQHETIERYLKLMIKIQELLVDKTVHYQEQQVADRVYKTAWFEEK
ncbi:MAG: hypothetical protein ACTSXA_06415 [Candidatus Heimdallarchaeota archaeon]